MIFLRFWKDFLVSFAVKVALYCNICEQLHGYVNFLIIYIYIKSTTINPKYLIQKEIGIVQFFPIVYSRNSKKKKKESCKLDRSSSEQKSGEKKSKKNKVKKKNERPRRGKEYRDKN